VAYFEFMRREFRAMADRWRIERAKLTPDDR